MAQSLHSLNQAAWQRQEATCLGGRQNLQASPREQPIKTSRSWVATTKVKHQPCSMTLRIVRASRTSKIPSNLSTRVNKGVLTSFTELKRLLVWSTKCCPLPILTQSEVVHSLTIPCRLARTPPRKKVSSQFSKLLKTNLTSTHQQKAKGVAKILGVAQEEFLGKTKNLGLHITTVLKLHLRRRGFNQSQSQVLWQMIALSIVSWNKLSYH